MKASCPVCTMPKDKRWHLVCASCWAKVPAADQAEVYRLYNEERNSPAHTRKCRAVISSLYIAQRVARRGARRAFSRSARLGPRVPPVVRSEGRPG